MAGPLPPALAPGTTVPVSCARLMIAPRFSHFMVRDPSRRGSPVRVGASAVKFQRWILLNFCRWREAANGIDNAIVPLAPRMGLVPWN